MELIEIRCPLKYKDKLTDKLKICNRLCVKVYPPGSGEAYCSSCKMTFEYEINEQAFMKTSVKAKSPNDRED